MPQFSTESSQPQVIGLATDHAATNQDLHAAVSWPAVIAGAFIAAALALILMAIGAGAGLSSLSPWMSGGPSPRAVGTGALAWLVVIELLSCGFGGYVAGRFRPKWTGVHPHERHFRDTAHGLLVWAVALVIAAAGLTSAATTMVGGEARDASARTDDAAAAANRYYVDQLFRTTQPAIAADATTRAEVASIFAHAVRERALAADDNAYVSGIVAAHTSLSVSDAQQRTSGVFEQELQAANLVRTTMAHMLYWLFVALLVGAFSASWMATIGGRHRESLHV